MIPPSGMAGVESREVDSLMMAPFTCMYAGCDYQTPTGATEEEGLEWLQIHDQARHNQAVIQQQQQELVVKLVENKLVGEPVVNKPGENFMNKKAANTRQGEQGELVVDAVDTVRMEQQLQAGSATLVGNQGDGEMISVGSGKIALQCGDCNYHTQQVNPKKARQRLAQHRKLSHTEVVVIPDQVEGGHLSDLLVQGGDFESPY